MSRQLGHPDPAALARLPASGLRAGLAGSRRSRRLSAHVARCPRCARVCAQLDTVSAALAASPAPALPGATERRILTALTVEAGRRAWHPGVPSGPGPARRRRDSHVFTSVRVLLPAAAGLLVMCTGIGYATLRTPQAASPGAVASGAASSPGPVAVGGTGSGSKEQSPGRAGMVAFMVTDTDTRYQKTTLRTQVQDRLAAQMTVPAIQAVPPASASQPPYVRASAPVSTPATGPGSTPGIPPDASMARPSRSLVGCVMHLTRDVRPEFVDRAMYQSEPVYVIAIPDEAWVVGIGCTATRPSLITSVQLTATS
jgi:hypothetical protein